MGLAAPTVASVPVDGGQNLPGSPGDDEVALDIQVVGGAAQGSRIAVYFAPNTSKSFVNAVSQAAQDSASAPSVISISWGADEMSWPAIDHDSMYSALQDAAQVGVSVFVACGDSLANDGINDGRVHVEFPASSPWAIGCGGTNIDTIGRIGGRRQK
jgi:kumamolisin